MLVHLDALPPTCVCSRFDHQTPLKPLVLSERSFWFCPFWSVGRLAQIVDLVGGPATVLMIEIIIRPFPIDEREHNAVSLEFAPTDLHLPIAEMVQRSGWFPGEPAAAFHDFQTRLVVSKVSERT